MHSGWVKAEKQFMKEALAEEELAWKQGSQSRQCTAPVVTFLLLLAHGHQALTLGKWLKFPGCCCL